VVEFAAVSQSIEDPVSSPSHRAGAPRAARPLSCVERFVCVPLGLLWLVVLTLSAVPVMIYMTLLYWAARGLARLPTGRGRGRRRDAESEERVA